MPDAPVSSIFSRPTLLALALWLAGVPGMQPAWAQGRCAGAGNAALKGMKVGQRIGPLGGDLSSAVGFASSYLVPTAGAPTWQDYKDIKCVSECDSAEVAFEGAVNNWSCRHSPARAHQFTSRLLPGLEGAWVEGVEGDGVGEVLVSVSSDRPGPHSDAFIWGGFAKSRALFEKNNRPRQVKVFILQGIETGNSPVMRDVEVIAMQPVELLDLFGYQRLPLPDFTQAPAYNPRLSQRVAVEIGSVYPGTQWRDTAISALKVRPHQAHDCSTGACRDLEPGCGGDLRGRWQVEQVSLRRFANVNTQWRSRPEAVTLEFDPAGSFRWQGPATTSVVNEFLLFYEEDRCAPPRESGATCQQEPPPPGGLTRGRCRCALDVALMGEGTLSRRFKVSSTERGTVELRGAKHSTRARYCVVGETLLLDFKPDLADTTVLLEARRLTAAP